MRATIFFLTFVVFVATVLWRVDQVMFGDKMAWGEAQSRAQMSPLVHALSVEIRSLRDLLMVSFSEVELDRKDFSAHRPYSRFQMMAKILPPNSKEDRKDWQMVSSFFQENSTTKKWAQPYITMALKTVKEADVKSGSAHVYALMDPTRKPFLLLVLNGGGNWYAGLLGTEVFQDLMDRQKGQKSTVFIVNEQGQALGHTVQEYVGSLLTEDPLVGEMIKSSVGSGFGTFKDLKGATVQGLYEQVEPTNLFAVITTPVSSLMGNRDSIRWQLALMGGGLALIGLAIFVFYDRGGERRFPLMPLPMAPVAPTPVGVNSTSVPTGQEKMKAFTQVASSLSLELKPPLTSILGHAQLALNHNEDPNVRDHLDKIAGEARGAREIVQKLLIFAGEDKVPVQKMGLETVVNRALKHVEGKILSKGIKLTKNIQTVPNFSMAGELVVRAVENILLNAIEAMERAPKKELNVQLKAEDNQIHLTIADTGEGIHQDQVGKIFDPFFTTRSGTQHVGLGLSTAMGIFKDAFGEVQVQSESGQGTTVTVVFKPQESLLAHAATIETPRKAPAVRPQPAQQVAPGALAQKNIEPVMAPLLVDNTIERLIEDDVPDMPPPPKEEFVDKTAAPPPQPTPAPAPSFSAKIDKPKIEIKKKTSRLDEMHVSVRRPGERL